MSRGATVVLVPGAWHGAWSWGPVIEELAGLGVPGVAVDPVDGGAADPPRDLHVDSDTVRGVLDDVPGPTVLCGHSYGGMVITEAGVHARVRHLVYLAAFLPDAEETVLDLALGPDTGLDGTRGIGIDDHGCVRLDPELAARLLYDACEPEALEWALANLTGHPLASFMQPPTALAWRHRPSTYVVCSQDRMIAPALQRRMASRATGAVEWKTGHSPFLSNPQLVARFLARTARAVT